MINITSRMLFAFLLFFLNVQTAVVQANPKLITQLQLFDNDTTFRYLYLYNIDGVKVLETCSYLQNNNIWKNKSQTEWIISSDFEFKQIERIWNGNKWVDQYCYTSNENKGIESERHYQGSENDNNLQKLIESKYESGRIISKATYSKFGSDLLLTDSVSYIYDNERLLLTEAKTYLADRTFEFYKDSFSYYSDAKLFQHIHMQQIGLDSWQNINQTFWYYNPENGRISSQRLKKWNAFTQVWENSQMYSMNYDENDMLVEENYYNWGQMIWEESIRYRYDYFVDGLLRKKSLYIPIYNQWRIFSNINYGELALDEQLEISSVFGFWGGNKDELVSADIPFSFNDEMIIRKAKRLKLIYSEFTDISQVEVKNVEKLLVYPNPSSGIFYFDQQNYHLKSWMVLDLNGSKILQSENNFNSGVVDLTGLSKGVYLLRAVADDKIMTQKLIKN